MISEKKFAGTYTTFWRELLPMGERFIRQQNMSLERFSPPLHSSLPPHVRGIVNEMAFRLFCRYVNRRCKEFRDQDVQEAMDESISYIRRFRESREAITYMIEEEERTEAVDLATRLGVFVSDRREGENVISFPRFHGCGIIDSCEGDILLAKTLYEIKAGDRDFRLVDLRQVLIYCALNYARPIYEIDAIGLVNPRRGVFFVVSLEALCQELSGVPANDVCFTIVEFISQPGSSR
jgi:hypothetical protein